jgi:hypothetical protein
MKITVFWNVMLCSVVDLPRSAEVVVMIYENAQGRIPEDGSIHSHDHENFKSRMMCTCFISMNFVHPLQIIIISLLALC